MIDTLYLANFIEEQLNANTLGKKFLIFADEGDLRKSQKKCCKERAYYTHGLLEVVTPTLVPIKNITFETASAQLMLIVDLVERGYQKEGQFERLQSTELLDVKRCIEQLISELNGKTLTVENGGKTYTVTVTLGQPTVGQKMSLGEISEGLPLYMQFAFSFFENGVNANDCHIYLNNEDLYFTRCVISKVKTADQNEFAGKKGGRSFVLSGGKSIDLVLPTVNTNIGVEIIKDILEDEINNAYAVRVDTPLYKKNFIGILGNNSVSMDAGANLGYNISIVQGVENMLKYGEKWAIEETSSVSLTKSILGNKIIFWGDDTSDYIENGGEIEHTYTDGKQKHIIRIYGE